MYSFYSKIDGETHGVGQKLKSNAAPIEWMHARFDFREGFDITQEISSRENATNTGTWSAGR